MRLNRTAFIFIWLIGAAIFFFVTTQLRASIDEGFARLPQTFFPLLGIFKILLFMGTGFCSGTLFITSKPHVHRALFFTVFVIFFVLSFYPLFLFVTPLQSILTSYSNFEEFAFIAGLSLFMSIYPFKPKSGIHTWKENKPHKGAQASEIV